MRLIDADGLCEGRVENDPIVIAAKCAPTVDPENLRLHGDWLFDDDMDRYCSRCGRRAPMPYFEIKQICTPYCPYCGAKMDGGEENG